MNSRVDKYYQNDNNVIGSRAEKNKELYKDISESELMDYEIKNNETILGKNEPNIDVDKIKSILDTHYNDTPARRSIKLEKEEPIKPEIDIETKEYDINVILNKAREDKEPEDVNAKLSDTSYEILKNLNINKSDFTEEFEQEDNLAKEKQTLQELINTITLHESDTKALKQAENEDDLFASLKDDKTENILVGQKEETQTLTEEFDKTETETIENELTETEAIIPEDTTKEEFFTKKETMEKDYEDFEDLDEGTGIFEKLIIILLAIAFIAGIVILVKTYL